MIIYTIILLVIIAVYFIYKSYIPILYEYKKGHYVIRSNNKYLDIDSYSRFSSIIWKSDKERLFKHKCIMHNLSLAQSIVYRLNK